MWGSIEESRGARAWALTVLLGLVLPLLSLNLVAGVAQAESTLFSLPPGGRAFDWTVGPGGEMWFGGVNYADFEGRIGRVTSSGQVTEFPLPEGKANWSGASSIVTGPDGNLWFTEPENNRIGRMTPSGEVVVFPLPASSGGPNSIAVGPDGNLWFTEGDASEIGRVTPSGAIAEFPLPRGRRPDEIVAGPDGNMWFVERGANRIGRITMEGEVSELTIPGAGKAASSLAVGPDGNLWFTREGVAAIGRLTPAGAFARFPVPATDAWTIAAGPDGNLWFVSGYGLGSISPSGRVIRLLCVTASCRRPAISLASGPDGALWFGTSIEYPVYAGGGTVQILTVREPGYVGRLLPSPPPGVAIGTAARPPLRGRFARIELSCADATSCSGALRLVLTTKPIPRSRTHPGAPGRTLLLGRRGYELASGESRPLALRLNRRAMTLLSMHGSLRAWAMAGTRSDTQAIQRVVLRRPASVHR